MDLHKPLIANGLESKVVKNWKLAGLAVLAELAGLAAPSFGRTM